jgi:hypothetical protein
MMKTPPEPVFPIEWQVSLASDTHQDFPAEDHIAHRYSLTRKSGREYSNQGNNLILYL